MRVKAAVLGKTGVPPPYAVSRPLELLDLDLAPPGGGEILVRIKAAGLCHSDLSVIDGSRPRPMPMALGHEAAGIVEELGEGVDDLSVGDHVVLVFVPSCGRCGPCAEGRPALCEPAPKANGAGTLLSGERRLTFSGEPVNHQLGVSAFADYAVVARESCVKIDPGAAVRPLRRCSAARCSPASARCSTPRGSSPARGRGRRPRRRRPERSARGQARRRAPDRRRRPADDKLAFARQLGATHVFNAGGKDALETIRRALKRRRRDRLRHGRRGPGARTRL